MKKSEIELANKNANLVKNELIKGQGFKKAF